MDTYDKSKIGKRIAWAGDHFVYAYGRDHVIKFSKFDFCMGYQKALQKSQRDIEICKTFFGSYLLETIVAVSPDQNRVALVQPRVAGHFLVLADLENESIRHQLREILAGYHAMIAAGNAEVDLIGQGGAFHRCLSNIFVTSERHLVLFDATTMDIYRYTVIMRPFFWLLYKLALWRQNSNLRVFERKLQKCE